MDFLNVSYHEIKNSTNTFLYLSLYIDSLTESTDPQIYISTKIHFFFKSWKLDSTNCSEFTEQTTYCFLYIQFVLLL